MYLNNIIRVPSYIKEDIFLEKLYPIYNNVHYYYKPSDTLWINILRKGFLQLPFHSRNLEEFIALGKLNISKLRCVYRSKNSDKQELSEIISHLEGVSFLSNNFIDLDSLFSKYYTFKINVGSNYLIVYEVHTKEAHKLAMDLYEQGK